MKKAFYILVLILLFYSRSFSQVHTEYYFKFKIDNKAELAAITQKISIDNVMGSEVFAYANQKELDEFLKMGYKIEFLQKDAPKSLTMATTLVEMESWDRYPTHEVYIKMMLQFGKDYPDICTIDTIGFSENGRAVLVAKISDHVHEKENEPEVFYTGQMHGDEIVSYIMFLRLIDHLLSTYSSDEQAQNIINNIELWINPLSNPDGTYAGGNNTVSSATRSNANGINLNRNYPDPYLGAHPDGETYQAETQMMMDFADAHHFNLSINSHSGAEVMNYPWDTWSRMHVDDNWYKQVSLVYADLAIANSPSEYFTGISTDGIINGYEWYTINGGRQDYMNYYKNCREITLELSLKKMLEASELPNFWNYNQDALLAFMEQSLFGIRGTVKSTEKQPLDAMIWILNHDSNQDRSMVFTDPDIGDYHRMIEPGTYDMVASSEGYINDTIKNIVVSLGEVVWQDFELVSIDDSISLTMNPNFITDTLFFDQQSHHEIIIRNESTAESTNYDIRIESEVEKPWIHITKNTSTLHNTITDTIGVILNSNSIQAGIYQTNLIVTSADSKTDTLPVTLLVKDTISIQIDPLQISDTIWGGESSIYPIMITNNGLLPLTYSIKDDAESTDNWIGFNKQTGALSVADKDTIAVSIITEGLGFGRLYCNIIIEKEGTSNDTIPVNIWLKDTIASEVNQSMILDTLNQGDSKRYPLILTNTGKQILEYFLSIDFSETSETWAGLEKENGSIVAGKEDSLFLVIKTTGLTPGDYQCSLVIHENDGDSYSIPIHIYVNQLQSIKHKPEITNLKLYPNPFSDQIQIKFYTMGSIQVKLNMYTIFGNKIFEKAFSSLNNVENNIVLNDHFNIQNLRSGIYFIQLSSSNDKITRKLIKK